VRCKPIDDFVADFFSFFDSNLHNNCSKNFQGYFQEVGLHPEVLQRCEQRCERALPMLQAAAKMWQRLLGRRLLRRPMTGRTHGEVGVCSAIMMRMRYSLFTFCERGISFSLSWMGQRGVHHMGDEISMRALAKPREAIMCIDGCAPGGSGDLIPGDAQRCPFAKDIMLIECVLLSV
jgi:hypothetical protein